MTQPTYLCSGCGHAWPLMMSTSGQWHCALCISVAGQTGNRASYDADSDQYHVGGVLVPICMIDGTTYATRNTAVERIQADIGIASVSTNEARIHAIAASLARAYEAGEWTICGITMESDGRQWDDICVTHEDIDEDVEWSITLWANHAGIMGTLIANGQCVGSATAPTCVGIEVATREVLRQISEMRCGLDGLDEIIGLVTRHDGDTVCH